MSAAWIVLLALGAPPSEAAASPAASPSPAEAVEPPSYTPRTGVELRAAVRDALPRWAHPTDEEAQPAAVEFLRLYDELQNDDRLARSQRASLKNKVRLRLLDLSAQISKRIARQSRLAKRKAKSRDELPASVDLPQGKGEPLAQDVAVANFAGNFQQSGFGQAGGRGGDYGPQLVDLIQRTIAPHTWQVNGGLGSIYYWYPGRAIVVRQTDAVHEEIGGLLRQLDRANR